ncbi:hypothetical protein [Sutcliffiella rhizosphaerae]|uniref:DUF2933 domain-containing protein n=1 Tax=Sutcliffiella rhizosphaerae TaxID=2880967 RepID=A0ABN8AE77_9BACI|nr:hypothetical protein [Sutcliffiella rhizosphaerae]CAG9621498.1 hypothetical protein BACCIP111883_02271 [Sutcliffiella rhizosphaerae]
MKLLQKTFYITLKLLAVTGFAVLFYFMINDTPNNAPIFTFSMLTTVCLLSIHGMKHVLHHQEESQHHGS